MGDLSLYLDDHHQMIREMVREFALAEIAPVAAEFDESEEFPWENGAKMAEIGLFGIPFDEDRAFTAEAVVRHSLVRRSR